MSLKSRTRGFTLLEVLIALLIFSIGLLGMAGLLILSVKANHSAYLRTQATFLAQSMADRMRANMPRVWHDDYSTTYPASATDPCASGAACSRQDMATRDIALWSTQLTDLLPNSSAEIACEPTAGVVISEEAQDNGAPYAGLCTLSITWSEASLNRGASGADAQSFVWVFQP